MQTILIGHGKMRIDRGTVSSVIIDPKAKLMTVLDHEKKEFMRVDEAALEEMGKAWKEGMDALKDLLASMPPDERGEMEAAMKGLMTAADDVKVVESGASSVAGKPCRVYRTTAKDVVINESCVIDIAALNLSTIDRDTMTEAMVVQQNLSQKMIRFISPQASQQLSLFASGQLALRSTDLMKGERNTSEFVRITTDALPSELFTVPATYKEGKIDGLVSHGSAELTDVAAVANRLPLTAADSQSPAN